MFKDCLAIFTVTINLLSQGALMEFMNQSINAPLKIIIQKLIICEASEIEDIIEIIQFLTTYAEIPSGSEHLVRENILQYLSMNQCILNSKMQDLYTTKSNGDQVRNPMHILWCHVLVLIRTINSNVIDQSQLSSVDQQDYLKKLFQFFNQYGFGERVQSFLCYLLN